MAGLFFLLSYVFPVQMLQVHLLTVLFCYVHITMQNNELK